MTLLASESAKTQKIYKVSEVTREIRTLLESRFQAVWVEGEISNLKRHGSGHIYLTLKDESAQMPAVFFSGFNQFLKFKLEDGLRVICVGRISVYDRRGQYQLYIQRIEPKGLGALQLAFLQLKEKLEKEGLFRTERKRKIPLYPRRIGLVTSPTGAAIQDMLKIFKKRTYGLHVILVPARVQGEGAAGEISAALDYLNRRVPLDVVILGRGGGSLEDLWAFNEETVARAIARSQTPVISAVGHEVDWTIADFVADYRAHTPTAAAEKIVSEWDELTIEIRHFKERMGRSAAAILDAKREALEGLINRYAFRQPKAYLEQMIQRVDELLRQLQNYLRGVLERKQSLFRELIGKLNSLSPLAILERGYSITFDERGGLITGIDQVSIGEVIRTRVRSGEIDSKIVKTRRA